MKFLVTKELQSNTPLKHLVGILLGVLILFLLTDILLHHYQIGLTLAQAESSILGNEEEFIEPMLFDMLLERIHIDVLTSLITLMLLALIYIRVSSQPKAWLLHTSFMGAILTQLALLSSFWWGKLFIALWIGLFILWHIIAIWLGVVSLWRLYGK